MKTALALLTVLSAATLFFPPPAARAAEPDTLRTATLGVGDVAPDFALLSDDWKPIALSDYRDKNDVILAFYVLAFTGG